VNKLPGCGPVGSVWIPMLTFSTGLCVLGVIYLGSGASAI
jgi:hypothetical protein